MSGGVDSSVAAALMKEQGCECAGVTLELYGTAEGAAGSATSSVAGSVEDAKQAARLLGMTHDTIEFTEVFKNEVIYRFIQTYESGGTPNPCIDCNRHIKFNMTLLKTKGLDFDILATGHYAKIERDASGRLLLKKAADLKKDQSYVLYSLSQDQLLHTCFPLGGLSKNEVRELANGYGFFNADKADSQDICFVPDGDYGSFMENYTGKSYPEGDILDTGGKTIGRHRGIVRYTLGQRRGLGVAVNTPVYVTAKDMAANTITLGEESYLYSKYLFARNINLIACDSIDKPLCCNVRTRYLQQEKPAVVEQTGPDEFRVDFNDQNGQRAVTPGQAVVLYDGDVVIGGGTIC